MFRPRKVQLEERARSQVEIADPRSVELYPEMRTVTLAEQIRRAVREEVSRAAVESGHGTFRDEDDFEEEDSELVISDYQFVDMIEEAAETLDGTPPSFLPNQGEASPGDATEEVAADAQQAPQESR